MAHMNERTMLHNIMILLVVVILVRLTLENPKNAPLSIQRLFQISPLLIVNMQNIT